MKKYSNLVFLLVLFTLLRIEVFSGDCSSINSLATNEVNDFHVVLPGVGTVGTIDFKFTPPSTSDGVIVLDWSTLTNKHPGMTEEALKDFVLNAILRKMANDHGSSTIKGWGVYTTSKCYTTINCVYKVDNSRNVCCVSPPNSSPVQIWEQNNEKFVSIPVAKYICSIKCCKSYYELSKGFGPPVNPNPLYPTVFIRRKRESDEVISECSQVDVAPHCLLSTDPNSPYHRPYDPNPISAPCLGDCP